MILHKSTGPSPGESSEQLPGRATGSGLGRMANRTNTSAPYYSYEYYLDYLDLMPVDEKKLAPTNVSPELGSWPIGGWGLAQIAFLHSLMNPRISRKAREWDSELVDRREWRVYLLSSVLSWKLAS